MDKESLKRSIYDATLDGAKMKHIIRDRHIRGFNKRDFLGNETLYREQFGDTLATEYIAIAMKMRDELKKTPMSLEAYLSQTLTARRCIPKYERLPTVEGWLLDAALDVRCAEDRNFFDGARQLASEDLNNSLIQVMTMLNIDAARNCILHYLSKILKEDLFL